MAKIGFTKLGLKPNEDKVNIRYNDQIIEVKQYLPLEDKLAFITKVITLAHDANNFSNPLKVEVFTFLGIIEEYTNINLTQKQKETPTKIYDLFQSTGLKEKIINAIPEKEYKELIKGLHDSIESVYKYQNSVLGVLDAISQDYKGINFDLDELQDKLMNPEQLQAIKSLAEFSDYVQFEENKE